MISSVLTLIIVSAPDGERPPPEDPARLRADLALLCGVESKSGAASIKDAAKRAEKIATYLSKQQFGADYELLFSEVIAAEPDNKPSLLLTFARLSGLTSCAFAEHSHRELLTSFKTKCASRAPPESSANDASAASQPWCDRLDAAKTLWNVAKQTQPRPR